MPNKYSSDTSDKEWNLIEKIINTRKGKQGRPPPKDARMLWDAMFYGVRSQKVRKVSVGVWSSGIKVC